MSEQDELIKIYTKIDSNMRKHKEVIINLAKSKGYEFFGEYIHKEYANRTAKDIQEEIASVCVSPPSQSHIWTLSARIETVLRDYAEGINQEIKETDKICYNCMPLKRKVAKGNHSLCKVCESTRYNIAKGSSYQEMDRHGSRKFG